MKTAKLVKKNVYELRPPVKFKVGGRRRKARFVVVIQSSVDFGVPPLNVFPSDENGLILDTDPIKSMSGWRSFTVEETLELEGYVIVENNNLYPYSPMKPMGNFADNIDRGR